MTWTKHNLEFLSWLPPHLLFLSLCHPLLFHPTCVLIITQTTFFIHVLNTKSNFPVHSSHLYHFFVSLSILTSIIVGPSRKYIPFHFSACVWLCFTWFGGCVFGGHSPLVYFPAIFCPLKWTVHKNENCNLFTLMSCCLSSAKHKRRYFKETDFVRSLKINAVQNNTKPHWLSLYGQKNTFIWKNLLLQNKESHRGL